MKTLKVLVNSKTSGKYKREDIDGRSHLVTIMMPIRGDITMNGIYYPDKEVNNSFMQLDMLPAPNGHPSVNGVSVSAFHPVANNKHNIGGFLRNPRKKGKRVFVDFLLDEEIANNSDAGKETIRRIEAGERIGVSTGLGITQVENKTGTDDFGKKYQREGAGFKFDHVATLLNEAAAGEHAGTELILNEKDEEILVYNSDWKVNELSSDQVNEQIHTILRTSSPENTYAWLMEVYPDSKTFVFSFEASKQPRKLFKQSYAVDQNDNITLIDDKIEVVKKQEFIPKPTMNNEVSKMDKSKLVLAIIGNSNNTFTVADNDKLCAMSDTDLCEIVGAPITAENAKEILANDGEVDLAGYAEFQENKAAFVDFNKEKANALKSTVDHIVANSQYTPEMLKGKSEGELKIINEMLTPEKVAAKAGFQADLTNNTDDEANAVSYDD
jgi:hypothetical protein